MCVGRLFSIQTVSVTLQLDNASVAVATVAGEGLAAGVSDVRLALSFQTNDGEITFSMFYTFVVVVVVYLL